jgi:hypothetical protein
MVFITLDKALFALRAFLINLQNDPGLAAINFS